MVGLSAIGPDNPLPSALASGLSGGMTFAAFAHIPGLVPELLASLGMIVATRRVASLLGRLAVAAFLGAATTGLFLIPLIHANAPRGTPIAEAVVYAAPAMLAGAIAALILTALVERIRPRAEGPYSPSNSAVER
ncbi:hypothetical protein ACFOWB_04160 [Chenggangzhangella methanolivorans]